MAKQKFPDLDGDGKVTRKDILIGRGILPGLKNLKDKIMPTVNVNGKKRQFPYNAVGKAQADSYARMNKGKIKNNPGYHSEKTMGSKMY